MNGPVFGANVLEAHSEEVMFSAGGRPAKQGGGAVQKDEYGRLARIYDPLTAPFLDPIRRSVARRARLAGCVRVLDICCGTGRQCLFLDRAGVEAAGVDSSSAMLAVARKRSPPAVAYFRQDAVRLGFADNSFHGAVICLALHEKPHEAQKAILREAARVLIPGGPLFLVDFVLPTGLAGRAVRLALAGVERLAGREHYARFRAYSARGGMTGLRAEMPFEPAGRERRFFVGNVELAVLTPSQ